ncbi:MAG: 7-carboxy-7-deazaguanine synthase QueE, partial [Caldilineaceae bacterium]
MQEVFYTIQGEGPFSGQPAVFIRLAGCHLACTFCDTEFESGINNRLTVAEIVADATRVFAEITQTIDKVLVVLTGGEPLRQTTGRLGQELIMAGFAHIQYETAGNLWDDSITELLNRDMATIVCSPKTPRLHPMMA